MNAYGTVYTQIAHQSAPTHLVPQRTCNIDNQTEPIVRSARDIAAAAKHNDTEIAIVNYVRLNDDTPSSALIGCFSTGIQESTTTQNA